MSEDRQRAYGWADPRPAALLAAELDGLTFTQKMIDGEIQPPPIGPTLGIEVIEAEKGRTMFRMHPEEFHYNPMGGVHGGVIATLLDAAAGGAVQTTLEAGVGFVTIDLSVKYLRGISADSGQLLCEGTVIHAGKRTALSEARLYDQKERLCAQATSSLLLMRP